MPRTVITPQTVTSAGLAAQYEPANASGNSFRLATGVTLHVKNGGASACNLTIPTPMQVDGLDVADRTIAVPAGAAAFVALGTGSAYRQPGGVAFVNYDQVTSVTVAVLTVP